MEDLRIEKHPFEPFLPENARLLICGTFPATSNKWSMKFYYPNFINDMWRIFGLIYFEDKDMLVDSGKRTFRLEKIKDLLTKLGIAFSDTGREIVRLKGNASDKFLQIEKPIDLGATLSVLPDCRSVATTGEKAAGVIAEITGTTIPKVGEFADCMIKLPSGEIREFRNWRMPSTSRAYPLRLEAKAAFYRNMLKATGLLDEKIQ